MNFNIWTAEISVAFKIIGFFFFSYTCMLQINLFLNLYFIYLYVILIFFVSILKADESGE
jgi:hypothetical protein